MASDTRETRDLTTSRYVGAPPERVFRAFDEPGMAGETTVTVTFEAVTEVTLDLAVPAARPGDGIAGWEAALGNLAALQEDT